MSKKKLMYSIFAVTFIIFFVIGYFKFCELSNGLIEKDKNIITINKKADMSDEKFVELLCDISEDISVDIALQYLNEDYTYTYYTTSIDESFFLIDTEDGSTLPLNGKIYASSPKEDEIKIYGFIGKNNSVKILHITEALKEKDINLSKGNYIVKAQNIDKYINELEKFDIESENSVGMAAESDFTLLYIILIMFVTFCIISVVFYAFSEGRDIAVKRSMGYGTLKICYEKLKSSFMIFAIELLLISLISILVGSNMYDLVSSWHFLLYLLPNVLLIFVMIIVIFVCSFYYVCSRCDVRHIKGMSYDRELFVVASIFKTVVLIVMVWAMSSVCIKGSDVYKMYKTMKNVADLTNGYAVTEINISVEDPDDAQEEYTERFTTLYNWLYEKHNAILSDLEGIDNQQGYGDNPYIYPIGEINDHYIDFNDGIISSQGNRITSSCLVKGKINVLIPEGYDTTRYSKLLCRQYKIECSDINYIEYDKDSVFFTFDNETCKDENGYCKDVILKVFDIDYEKEHTISESVYYEMLSGFFSGKIVYKYDVNSDISAFSQIKGGIYEAGLERIMIATPTVHKIFMEKVNFYIEELAFYVGVFVLYVFAFFAMLIYTTELYYRNNAKDITVKLVHGHTFLSIFGNRMILKTSVLPVMIILNIVSVNILPVVSIGCVCVELLIFCVLIKIHIRKNAISIIKGE